MVEIFKEKDGKFYYDSNGNKIYITDDDGKKLYVTNAFIDISYSSRQSESSVLSNLFPYTFNFRRYRVASVEGVLQGIKYKDMAIQREIYNYSGKDAYHIRVASFIEDWRKNAILYFNCKEINRFSIEYQQLLNDLYLSLMNNPLFVNSLKYTGQKVLIHSDGVLDPNETVLTSKEYIMRLEYMRKYLVDKNITKETLHQKLDTLAEVITEEQAHMKKLI